MGMPSKRVECWQRRSRFVDFQIIRYLYDIKLIKINNSSQYCVTKRMRIYYISATVIQRKKLCHRTQ